MGSRSTQDHIGLGIALVAGSAILWSFGGAISRYITVDDSWTVVFWRSYFATLFLLIFLVLRDGLPSTVSAFRDMGRPGLLVAACFTIASTSFVIALAHTTVANILLMQAGVPLLAALISWLVFRERTPWATWAAILLVIVGVGVMVSNTFTGKVSPIGDGLALLIAYGVRHRDCDHPPSPQHPHGACQYIGCVCGYVHFRIVGLKLHRVVE